MGASGGPNVVGTGPGILPPAARVDHRIGLRIIGVLGLAAALVWSFFGLVGLAWMYDSSAGARYADSVGGLAFLQAGMLILGFIVCLWGSPVALRSAAICAVVVGGLALAITLIGDREYWQFGPFFAVPDLLLVVGIVAMSRRGTPKDRPS